MSNLPFGPWKIEQVTSEINSKHIEEHLSDVYSAISQGNPHEKMHSLNYFESIIVNSNVANRLINSAFVELFVDLLMKVKST